MTEPHLPATGGTLVSIYEAINDSLKEVYLGKTTHAGVTDAGRFLQALPRAVSHWEPSHAVTVRIVESSLKKDDAGAFLRHYAASLVDAGWRAFHEEG